MLAARHVLSLCHRLVPGPAAAQGLPAPEPKLPALCTHDQAPRVNSSILSSYGPGSPQFSCTVGGEQGESPEVTP